MHELRNKSNDYLSHCRDNVLKWVTCLSVNCSVFQWVGMIEINLSWLDNINIIKTKILLSDITNHIMFGLLASQDFLIYFAFQILLLWRRIQKWAGFIYIVAVSFNGGGNWSSRRKPPTCCKSLTNFIT
jgi:hypothetical protein